MKTKFTQEEVEKQAAALVENEVYCSAGDVPEVYASAGKIDWGETCAPDICPNCCSPFFGDNENKTDDHPEDYHCPECGEYFDYPHEQEVFEWWFVSPFLAQYLAKIGALIITTDFLPHIWGRTETGASLKIDSDIERAAVAVLEAVEKVKNGIYE